MLNQNIKRFLMLSIMAIAAIFSLSSQSSAQELLLNGGFETNTVGWTVTHTNASTANAYTRAVRPGENLYNSVTSIANNYLHTALAQEGSRSCMMALSTSGLPSSTATISQSFTVPTGKTLVISWKNRYSQANLTALTTNDITLRVRLKNSGGTVLQTIYQKILLHNVNEVSNWESLSVNLGTTYGGQTITLEFSADVFDASTGLNNTQGVWEFDGVSANALVPTAAAVTLSGKVKDANGKAMPQVRVRIMDMDGNVHSVLTNKFGYYEIREVEAGQTYAMEAYRKDVKFINNPRIINVVESLDGEDFYAEDPQISK